MDQQLSQEDLVKLLKRERFVREQLNNRVAALLGENLELLAVVQELTAEVQELRAARDGEVHPEILTDLSS
jgi:uncharacterized coiled-coil DUF342 family protein